MNSLGKLGRILLPVIVLTAGLAAWEAVVRINDIQPYVLPGPLLVLQTLVADWRVLSESLGVTLLTTLEGFIAAAVGGVGLALLFNQSKLLEYSLFPYAVILQVTPVIAIAPLLLIYLPQQTAVIVCAWIVGFFPVLSNTTLGLNSVDRNLAGLFELYGASRLQTLRYLKLPAALPYILGGLRIAGGLSLIGAVVAEIAAGLPEPAGGAALYPGGPGDGGGPVADGRRVCGNGGGRGGGRLGPGLPYRRIRLPPQHPPNVRGTLVAVGGRDCHLWAAGASF